MLLPCSACHGSALALALRNWQHQRGILSSDACFRRFEAKPLLLPSSTGGGSDRATPNADCFAVISMQWLCPCSCPQELAVCSDGQGECGGPPAAADGEERGAERAQELGAHSHDREVRRGAQGCAGKAQEQEGKRGSARVRKGEERERVGRERIGKRGRKVKEKRGKHREGCTTLDYVFCVGNDAMCAVH